MGDIVSKFGGTSVAGAVQIRKIESIIRSDSRRRYIVVSAPGRRGSNDEKITDLLYTCQSLSAQGKQYDEPFGIIYDRFVQIDRELHARSGVRSWMEQLRGQLESGASADLAASRGEYLCARLLATYLKATFVDAADIVRLNGNDSVDESTYELAAKRLTAPGLYVIPGFYGATSTGEIKTFSRGGSDITGALVARAVQAEMYENWTDVSGLLMADPQIVRDPRPMAEVTYREIRELSFMGAKVLHEEAILPVYKQRIPINIRNTNRPEDPGTMIQAGRNAGIRPIAGVSGRNGLGLLYLEKFLLRKDPLYRSKIFEILKNQGLDWEWERAGIDSLSIVFSEGRLAGKQEFLMDIIKNELRPDHLEILQNMSVIAVVGEGLSAQPGFIAHLLLLLLQKNIEVRLIDQGSSKITVLFLVHSKDFQRAIRAIYCAVA